MNIFRRTTPEVPVTPDTHKTIVGKYLTGPIVDSIQAAVGKIICFPLRLVDKAVDGTVAWLRDSVKGAILGVLRFPVDTKK
jgi:hypothetical protein